MSSITQNNDNSSESLLKEDSIENIFKYDYTEKKTYTTDITLQIIHMKKNETGNIDNPNEIYTASLCDKKFSYNRFVICRNPSLPLIEEGDLIKITKLCPMKLESQPERVILIKEYAPLGINQEIKGTTLMKEAISNAGEEDSNVGNMEGEEMKASEIGKYIPLNQLTTFSKEFVVYVRVVSKSEIKRFNGKRSGSLFDFVVIDEEGTKMQIVCFDKTVDKFYGMIHENNCYEISGGYIKINDRKYNALNSEYKIILGEHSSVIQKEDNHKIKLETMALTSIQDIMSMKINSVINVLCLVIDEGKKIVKTTRNGDQEMRRTMVIDKTGAKIELTLWRQFANMNIQRENVLLLKKVRIGDFNGRNLSSLNETNITISPTEPSLKIEIDELVKFFIAHKNEMYTPQQYEDNKQSNQSANANSNINSIVNEVKNTNSNINPIGKIDFLQSIIDSMSEEESIRYPFYKIKATVTHLSHNDKNFYPGCPDKECARKLVFDINKWVCQRCKRTYDSPRYYYSLNIRVKDCSCEYWIDIFGKTAETFLKMSAGDYRALLINRDEDKLRAISGRIENNDFYFLVKPKVQKFNNIPKKKFSVNKIENVEPGKEAYRLLEQIKEKLFIK